MPPDRLLAVTTKASAVRRSLAPSAWAVLEELVLTADAEGVAVTSSRQLAESLGISKDTAARSLQRLMAAALVERIEQRDPATGRFGTVAYAVDIGAAGLELVRERRPARPADRTVEPAAVDGLTPTRTQQPTPRRSPRRADTSNAGDQLDLFGA
jgi:DNA-binding transcriptional MocR family regulator